MMNSRKAEVSMPIYQHPRIRILPELPLGRKFRQKTGILGAQFNKQHYLIGSAFNCCKCRSLSDAIRDFQKFSKILRRNFAALFVSANPPLIKANRLSTKADNSKRRTPTIFIKTKEIQYQTMTTWSSLFFGQDSFSLNC